MSDGAVVIDIKGDKSDFDKEIKGLPDGVKTASKAIIATFTAIALAATTAFAGVFKLTQSASDLAEAQNVVQQTFKESGAEVLAWTKTMDEAAGVSETNAVKMVGSMGAMLKSSGLFIDDAKDMSERLVELTGDMSSFYNLSHEDAWEKIRSGIAGETEPLKQLGINMSVANLEAYALAQGIKKSYSEMTQAEQTTLRYNYLLSVTKDAQGDFGRTLETSFPNQMRVAEMQLKSFGTSVGQEFLPVFLDALKQINAGLKENDFEKVGAGLSAGIEGAIKKAAELAPEFATLASNLIMGFLSGIVTSMPDIVNATLQLMQQIINTIVKLAPQMAPAAVKAILALIKGIVSMLPQIIKAGMQIVVSLIKGVASELPSLIPALVDGVLDAVMELINNVPVLIDAGIKLVQGLITGMINAIPQIVIRIPEIIAAIVQALLNGIGQIANAIFGLFTGATTAAAQGTQQLTATMSESINVVDTWAEAMQNASATITDLSNVVGASGLTYDQLQSKIDANQNAINTIFRNAAGERRGLRDSELRQIAGFNEEIQRLQKEQLGIYEDNMTAVLMAAQARLKDLTPQNAANILADAKAGYDQIVKYADQVYKFDLIQIEKGLSKETIEEVTKRRDSIVEKAEGMMNEVKSTIQEGATNWVEPMEEGWKKSGDLMQTVQEANKKYWDGFADLLTQHLDPKELAQKQQELVNQYNQTMSSVRDQHAQVLTDMLNETNGYSINNAAAWLHMIVDQKQKGEDLSAESKTTVAGMLSVFDSLPPSMKENGRQALLQMIDGYKGEIPGLENAASMSSEEIINTIENYLGVSGDYWSDTYPTTGGAGGGGSPMTNLGSNAGKKLAGGLTSQAENVRGAGKIVGEAGKDGADEGILGTNGLAMSELGSDAMSDMKEGIKAKENDIADTALSIGRNLFDSIGKGGNSVLGSLLSTVWRIATSVMDTIKKAFGINSPSTFGLGVGENLGLSVVSGVEGVDIGGRLSKVLGVATSGIQAVMNVQAAQAQGSTTNNSWSFTSNQPLGTREILQEMRLREQQATLLSA